MKVIKNNPFTAESVERKLTLMKVPLPDYTKEAWETKIWGTVVLRVMCDASGQVSEAEVVVGLLRGLSETAVEAAKGIEFLPALREGHAVSQSIEIGYAFSLRSERAELVLL